MSASLHVPLAITAKTTAEISTKLLSIQAEQAGRVQIVSIYYDTENKVHVCWYYPIRGLGTGMI